MKTTDLTKAEAINAINNLIDMANQVIYENDPTNNDWPHEMKNNYIENLIKAWMLEGTMDEALPEYIKEELHHIIYKSKSVRDYIEFSVALHTMWHIAEFTGCLGIVPCFRVPACAMQLNYKKWLKNKKAQMKFRSATRSYFGK